jgi:hypothetical protein
MRHGVRTAAGPFALAGFFLPWAHGPGVLAASEFTGFSLVAFTGRLQQLDLSVTAGAVLLAIRIAILMVAVCATWLTLLAPLHSWHFGYTLSGWYIVVLGLFAATIGLLRAGLEFPPIGLGLWLAGSVAFVATWLSERLRWHRPTTKPATLAARIDEPVHWRR